MSASGGRAGAGGLCVGADATAPDGSEWRCGRMTSAPSIANDGKQINQSATRANPGRSEIAGAVGLDTIIGTDFLAAQGSEDGSGGTKSEMEATGDQEQGVKCREHGDVAIDVLESDIRVIMHQARIGRASALALLKACEFDMTEALAVFERALSRAEGACRAESGDTPTDDTSAHGARSDEQSDKAHVSGHPCEGAGARKSVPSLASAASVLSRPEAQRQGSDEDTGDDMGSRQGQDQSDALMRNGERMMKLKTSGAGDGEHLTGSALELLSAFVSRWASRRRWVRSVTGLQVMSAAVRKSWQYQVREVIGSAAERGKDRHLSGRNDWGQEVNADFDAIRKSTEREAVARLSACILAARLSSAWCSNRMAALRKMPRNGGRERGTAGYCNR